MTKKIIAATEPARDRFGVDVTVTGDGKVEVDADFDRLAQVFINVITNAVKYGRGDPPRIDIKISSHHTRLRIDLADNGPGIASADRARVFEKFARLEEATLAGGAGLGLPISREIMRNLGGNLTLIEGGPGAPFRVTIPKVMQSTRAAE